MIKTNIENLLTCDCINGPNIDLSMTPALLLQKLIQNQPQSANELFGKNEVANYNKGRMLDPSKSAVSLIPKTGNAIGLAFDRSIEKQIPRNVLDNITEDGVVNIGFSIAFINGATV